jgi:hypothetical protein
MLGGATLPVVHGARIAIAINPESSTKHHPPTQHLGRGITHHSNAAT